MRGEAVKFSRYWAMPSADTFSIPVIGQWVKQRLAASSVSVDPFARNKRWATHTNDLNPDTAAESHLDARDFLRKLAAEGVRADLVIFDPPYSPRQISEVYKGIGKIVTTEDTQSAALYSECRDLISEIIAPGAVVLSFGWNSVGMGAGRGFDLTELLLVCHGGAHNDTICIEERHTPGTQAELL